MGRSSGHAIIRVRRTDVNKPHYDIHRKPVTWQDKLFQFGAACIFAIAFTSFAFTISSIFAIWACSATVGCS